MLVCRVFRIFRNPARVAIIKFVGTVSLGLLTGMSYSLTTLAIPSILSLPSATAAAHALSRLSDLAASPLHLLSRLSCGAFLLAFLSAPRAARHLYLLYTSLFAGAAGLANVITPMLAGQTTVPTAAAASRRKNNVRALEASYEDLGSSGVMETDTSVAEDEETQVNGEQVRAMAENFAKTRFVETGFSSIAFAMAVMGIWGDGGRVM
ncbi:hypothetical protein CFO_g177 [Ceratocystis platani]|uniref:Autophagy-related protein 33 n=1 Tax=Ceratocystis fimbriata f. sp. platani TaxID=88771 RepID=A0A0F8B8T6_CERFI|nr:hypothetical protein CFO_g177 [Ceratocystis platani]